MDLTFKGAAKRLDDIDLPRIGARIGVGEDELHAFMDVEAAGSGFDAQGRPKMLFEPHVFYRNLSGDARKKAVAAGLAYAKWGTKPYPSDSYPRLKAAMAISESVALKSASWGLTQILAEYHKDVGYATPQAMVEAFMADEENHIAATVQLLIKWKIDDDLRAHRWPTVASVWNGPGYKKNRYDAKMAAAFAKWQKRPDTKPASPQQPAPAPLLAIVPKPAPVAAPVTDKEQIKRAQVKLNALNYNAGTADGLIGPLTGGAIRVFRADANLPEGNFIDDDFLLALDKAKPREMVPARANATVAQVAAVVPEANVHWWTRLSAGLLGGGVGGVGLLDQITPAVGYLTPVKDFIGDVPPLVWIIGVVLVCGALYLGSQYGASKATAAYQAGDRR